MGILILLAFLAMLIMSLRYSVAVPVATLEATTANSSVSRSVHLTRGHLGRVFLLFACGVIVTYATAGILQVPFMIGVAVAGPATTQAAVIRIAGVVLGTIGNTFVSPIPIIGLALMYYDFRIRKEGLDLDLMLDDLGEVYDDGRGDAGVMTRIRRSAASIVLAALLAIAAPAFSQPFSRPAGPPSSIDSRRDGDARAALQSILARKEFQQARVTAVRQTLFQRAWQTLQTVLVRTLGRRLEPRSSALAWAAPAVALAVLAFWMIRRRQQFSSDLVPAVAPPPAPGRELLDLALRLFAEGREREAIRAAYRAAVHRLAEEGAWRVDEARTPREYLGLLPAGHQRRRAMARLTAAFERGWYGSCLDCSDDRSAQASADVTLVLRESGWLRDDRAI